MVGALLLVAAAVCVAEGPAGNFKADPRSMRLMTALAAKGPNTKPDPVSSAAPITLPLASVASGAPTFHIVSECFDLPFCDVFEANTASYAQRHGYTFFISNINRADKSHQQSDYWSKLHTLLFVFDKTSADFIFWMDADSLFITPEKPLTVITDTYPQDLVASGDWNTNLNAGHLMLRRSEWVRQVITEARDIWPNYPKPNWPDQNTLIYIVNGKKPECAADICAGHSDNCIKHAPECNDVGLANLIHASYAPQNVMNSYAGSLKSGDLILHFAGAPVKEKDTLMRRYHNSNGDTVLAEIRQVELDDIGKDISTLESKVPPPVG